MIRPRSEEDLEWCIALLRRVHEVDRCPVVWPADPVGWSEALGVGVDELAIVSRFFVSPEVRGRGVGSALISRAEQHAALERLQLALDVAEHNREAIGFYERRGWRRVGNAELELSAEPWRLDVGLFVLS